MAEESEDLNEVHVILEGYSFTDEQGNFRATGTSTLIKTKKHTIIMDTGSPREKDKILKGLQNFNVRPEDIDHVICSHGHQDHVGNLNLFPTAAIIVCHDICRNDDIYEPNNPFKNGQGFILEADQVEILPTPGHTQGDISVVVRNTKYGTVVVAGDLFECKDDDGIWQDVSECPVKQKESREQILRIADWIIPGHGSMFKVK